MDNNDPSPIALQAIRTAALDSAVRYASLANPNATVDDVLAVAERFAAWLTMPVSQQM